MKDRSLFALHWCRAPLERFGRLSVVIVLALVGLAPAPAVAHENDSIEISGRGWGHGRGMGQYGAYGYAVDFGWSSAEILDHYYGGTSSGPAPVGGLVDPAAIRVELRFMRGRTTAVGLTQGSIQLRGTDEADLGQVDAGAVRLRWTGGGFEVETAASCNGPWSAHSSIDGRTTLRLVGSSSVSGLDGLLHACGLLDRVWYEGELRAVVKDGLPVTVNVVSVEDYLRGVVPNEMPALWPAQALEAQAVAARSYALAGDSRQQPYADTCDTTRCQVYDGVYTERGGFRSSSHSNTDAAIAATAGVVRLTSAGSVARTEFSSSTGGHTVGGDFTAVADLGDAISANPNHVWTTTVSRSAIESRYGLGALSSVDVVGRTGLGPDGGRASTVVFNFADGSVTETGDRVRSFLGLKSDWFWFGGGSGSELLTTTEGRYVDWVYRQLGGRPATNAELVYWSEAVGNGNRRTLTQPLARDQYFSGLLLDELYEVALGRPADSSGRTYWLGQIRAGAALDTIGASFYGSEEYYRRSGGTDQSFVDSLYADVLGRAPDSGGRRYWLARLAADSVPIHHVAAGFHASLESRHDRAERLHTRLYGTPPSTDAGAALAGRLLALDDLDLAAEMAASSEAYLRSP